MAEIILTQTEADALLILEKQRVDDNEWDFPDMGGDVRIPLISTNKREHFFLDLGRSSINLAKAKYQNRARHVVILVRLDVGGPPHVNPDGQEIPCPHIHLYKEGYGDKWAFPVPVEQFSNLTDTWQTLQDFMNYCNIVMPPLIKRGLFT